MTASLFLSLFEVNFWIVGPPNIAIPIAEGISQTDLNPLSQWLLTQDWIACSEELPIDRPPILTRGVLPKNRRSIQTNYSRFKNN